jgi:methyl-accepting chemotaxis protein
MEEEIKALAFQLENLRKVIAEIPMPLLWLDPDLNIHGDNKAFLQMSGIDHDTLLHMNIRDFKTLSQKGEGIKDTLVKKIRGFAETTAVMPTGEKILEQYTIPIMNSRGEIENILYVCRDITEATAIRQKEKEIAEQARLLRDSIPELKAGLEAMAAGDFTTRLAIRDDDPLKDLKRNYQTTVNALKETNRGLVRTMRQIETSTADSSKSAEEIAQSIEQVALKSQRTAEDSRAQLTNIEEVGESLSSLSAAVEEIASTCQEVLQATEEGVRTGDRAEELGRVAAGKMQAVETLARQSADDITQLNAQMQEITRIVKLITDISNQTNLLALNAAIEAARAGEHGRGFAVVAGEVRNLAGESKKATNDIETLITSIQAKSTETARSMEASYAELRAGTESVTNTIKALDQMIEGAKASRVSVNEIAKATEDQANSASRVTEVMEKAKEETRDIMKTIEEVAALTEEVAAAAEEVGSGSQEVAAMTTTLRNEMDRFKLD